MTFGEIPTGEKELARWEPISKLEDWEIVRTVHRLEQPDHPFAHCSTRDLADMYGKGGRGGMVLRRRDKAIGYLLYRAEDREVTELYIEKVHILKRERTPANFDQLIRSLKDQAQRLNAKMVRWDMVSQKMRKVSDLLGPSEESIARGQYTLPVEKLDASILIEMLRENLKKTSGEEHE